MLGRFVPSEFTTDAIARELRPLLPPCCQCERIVVRAPTDHPVSGPTFDWHQDGAADHLTCWASAQPTEIETSTGARVDGQPFDLVWVANTRARHRQPADTDHQGRWFALVLCNGVIF